jgi:hypothetical protein
MKEEGDNKPGLLRATAWGLGCALCLFSLYVLSVGPVGKAFTTLDTLKPYQDTVRGLYEPLIYLTDKCEPFRDFMIWYVWNVWKVS